MGVGVSTAIESMPLCDRRESMRPAGPAPTIPTTVDSWTGCEVTDPAFPRAARRRAADPPILARHGRSGQSPPGQAMDQCTQRCPGERWVRPAWGSARARRSSP